MSRRALCRASAWRREGLPGFWPRSRTPADLRQDKSARPAASQAIGMTCLFPGRTVEVRAAPREFLNEYKPLSGTVPALGLKERPA